VVGRRREQKLKPPPGGEQKKVTGQFCDARKQINQLTRGTTTSPTFYVECCLLIFIYRFFVPKTSSITAATATNHIEAATTR
jgi:hypothetical protein